MVNIRDRGCVSVVTAVAPSRSRYIDATGRSVEKARHCLESQGIGLEWVVVLDGPGEVPSFRGADLMMRLGGRRGVSTARNIALAHSTGNLIYPLDGDDLLNGYGLASLVDAICSTPATGWVAGNRTFINGDKTTHWFDHESTWTMGELAQQWTAPFIFHPNTVLYDKTLVLDTGGWPATGVNEDLGLLLLASESSSGQSIKSVVTKYRVWDQQELGSAGYLTDKAEAFKYISLLVNAKRSSRGRYPVKAPQSGEAYGIK